MLKDYLKTHHITVKSLSVETDIPYSTLNDIVNGKTEIDRVSFGTVRKISGALAITIDELADMCAGPYPVSSEYKVIIRNKKYYLRYNNEEIFLFKVNRINSDYISFAVDAYLDEERKKQEVEDKWMDYISLCEKTSL